jgi:hypothetical protein
MKLLGRESRTANSRFEKAGASCFYESEVLNSSFVHLMKFSAKKTRLRKAANRYEQIILAVQETTRGLNTQCDKRQNN